MVETVGGDVMTHNEIRAKILKLCSREYKTSREIAEALGMPFNTVRAHYMYKMTAEGLLEPRYPRKTPRQAYKKAAGG